MEAATRVVALEMQDRGRPGKGLGRADPVVGATDPASAPRIDRHRRGPGCNWSSSAGSSRRPASAPRIPGILLALNAFGVFSLPVSAPNAATTGAGAAGGETESADARPARPRPRRDLGEGLGERGAQWTEVISWEPRAFVYHNFLSKEECEYLIGLAKPHMVKSTVVDSTTGKSKDSRVRTSSGMFLQRGRDKVIRAIEKRIADYTFIPADHGEGLQVLHYEVGQKYEPHFDYFLDEFNTKNGGQRMATLLMYLSDVEEGGETIFPDANVNASSLPWYNELSECAKRGLSVKPKMGDALLFWSMKPDATLDPLSLHGGCPVIKGNKWSSTKWMHIHGYKA